MEAQLNKLGLSPSQAKAYTLLVDRGKLTPAEFVKLSGESRTNAYMVLDRLVQLKLAFKDEAKQKLLYRPSSPSGLAELAEQQRIRLYDQEQKIKAALPELLKYYHSKRTQPGIRFFQGKDGLKKVYQDHLETGGDTCVFRSDYDYQYYGEKDLDQYVATRAKQGIKAQLISPFSDGALANYKRNKWNREFHWIPFKSYLSPVEIMTYDGKVAITSFGEESVAMIIDSPQIAEAFREIFALAKTAGSTKPPKGK